MQFGPGALAPPPQSKAGDGWTVRAQVLTKRGGLPRSIVGTSACVCVCARDCRQRMYICTLGVVQIWY